MCEKSVCDSCKDMICKVLDQPCMSREEEIFSGKAVITHNTFTIEVLGYSDDDRPYVEDPDNYPVITNSDGEVIAKGLVEVLSFVDYQRFDDIRNIPGHKELEVYKNASQNIS